jgi:hypothetical protein
MTVPSSCPHATLKKPSACSIPELLRRGSIGVGVMARSPSAACDLSPMPWPCPRGTRQFRPDVLG